MKKIIKTLLVSVLALSTVLTNTPISVKAEEVNRVGDTATRGTNFDGLGSTFRWSSIPNFSTTSSAKFRLVDNLGTEHTAYCIDAHLPDGRGVDTDMRMVGEESGTIKVGALWALDTNQVSTTDINLRTPEKRVGKFSIPGINTTISVSARNMQMAMQWLMWTNGGTNVNASWVDDMNNLVEDAIPTLYYEEVTYTALGNGEEVGLPRPLTVKQLTAEKTVNGEFIPGAVRVSVKTSTPVTRANYATVIDEAELRSAYTDMLNSIANQVKDRLLSIANRYKDNRITIWQGSDRYQRFATRHYLEQSVDITVRKTSSNTSVSNNNSKYSLAGIKYDIFKAENNEKIGTVTLNAEGTSNTIETRLVRPGEQVYIQEVDDAIRKQSGYKLNPNKIYHTIINGTNDITTSDEPFTDPIDIKIHKYDSRTGKKVSQGNATLEGAEFKLEYYPTDFTSLATATGTVQNTLVYRTNAQGVIETRLDSQLVSGTPYKVNGANTFGLGTVVVSEQTAPSGYLKSDEFVIVNFRLNADGTGVVIRFYDKEGNELTNGKVENNGIINTNYTFDVTDKSALKPYSEDVIRGNLEIIKKDIETNKQEPQGVGSLANIKYAIINRSREAVKVNETEVPTGSVVAIISTNEQGVATLNDVFW